MSWYTEMSMSAWYSKTATLLDDGTVLAVGAPRPAGIRSAV
jgi:hypothetical protein